MRGLFNLAGVFLIIGFALYMGACLATDLGNHTPPWASEIAIRRSVTLMVYFTVCLVMIAGFLILGAINHLL